MSLYVLGVEIGKDRVLESVEVLFGCRLLTLFVRSGVGKRCARMLGGESWYQGTRESRSYRDVGRQAFTCKQPRTCLLETPLISKIDS
jgi:hypothetical protein